ncbi:hypothetical protein [Streptomyces curacoi]|uniref:Uncharacterized protein n=1 Tax=Streptomyces curacoi TaxID=146536 RepID=A0A124GUW5_9ACTN|nr:hypothetical protein [Streptomyces curacoi]KUM68222.1 hypothetical protein AQI70_34085 [Streptomyces curacoi]
MRHDCVTGHASGRAAVVVCDNLVRIQLGQQTVVVLCDAGLTRKLLLYDATVENMRGRHQPGWQQTAPHLGTGSSLLRVTYRRAAVTPVRFWRCG